MEPKSSDSVVITIADTNKGPGPNDDIIEINNIAADHDHDEDRHKTNYVVATVAATAAPEAAAGNNYKKKRSGGAMQILQVAVLMLRRRQRSAGKSKSKPTSSLEEEAVASSKSTWKRLVGSIRPLHLESGGNLTPLPSANSTPKHPSIAPSERYEDVLPPPMSPARTDDLSSEDGMTSRYASAVNLQELDRTEEDDNTNANTNNANANAIPAAGDDHNIDAKAEEFIAQFYQQMKLQRLDSIDRRYHERMGRS